MTANDFLGWMIKNKEKIIPGCTLTLAPGPIALNIGKHDITAARLLLWLQEQLPEETATLGDLEDVLLAALFWTQFWSAAPMKVEEEQKDDEWKAFYAAADYE